jgi:hypothetical protein
LSPNTIGASGVGGLAVHWPPALGGGLKADDLASMIFEVRPSAFGDEQPDHDLRQAILDRLPTQIEGLQMRLEEVEAKSGGRFGCHAAQGSGGDGSTILGRSPSSAGSWRLWSQG